MSQTEVILYYSDGCGYCHQFRNESWEALTNFFDKNNVKWSEYEYHKNPNVIEQAEIKAFPTIRVKRGNAVDELVGLHEAGEIIALATPKLTQDIQMGGSRMMKWIHKREKYLTKLKLLKKNKK